MNQVIFQYDPFTKIEVAECYGVDCISYYSKKMLDDGYLIPALSQALLLPDICGNIIFNCRTNKRFINWFNMYVQSEYRISEQEKNEILNHFDEKNITLFNEFYSKGPYYFTGTDCYSLRCNLLHTNISKIIKYEQEKDIKRKIYQLKNDFNKFGFSLNTGESDVVMPIPVMVSNHVLPLDDLGKYSDDKGPYLLRVSISIKNLCMNICQGYENFKKELKEKKDFKKLEELYENYELKIYNE